MKTPAYLNTALPLEERVCDLVSRMTAEEKIGLLPTDQAAVARLGIGEYHVGGEGAHGVVDREGAAATVFPQPQGLSCTWDAPLLEEIGSAIGDEARVFNRKSGGSGWLTLWFPTIDMERDPRWGRNEEGYGEDPYLAGKLAAALIRGAHGDDPFYIKMSPAPKHFYANNVEENRGTVSSMLSRRDKYEYYQKVFSYAFKESRALSLMTAYNKVNGRPCMLNHEIRDVVKGEWGCDGFVVCDGQDFRQVVNEKRYVKTHAETLAEALRAGVDCFTDEPELVTESARKALAHHLISESDIDRAVYNILKVRFRLGQFDGDADPYAGISEETLCCEENTALSLQAARESVVLLKNDGFLPLSKESGRIAVIGEVAGEIYPDWYTGTYPFKVTPLDGLRAAAGEENVLFGDGRSLCAFIDTATGAYLRLGENGEALFDGDETNRAEFYESDWGYGSFSYQESVTNKHLRERYDGSLWVEADKVWGWFTLEWFKRREDSDEMTVCKGGRSLRRVLLKDGVAEAAQLASQAETAIIFVGNHPLINARECFDRANIDFPRYWSRLTESVAAANRNTVLVITAGYPFSLESEENCVRSVLYAAHGAQALGTALAEVLFGDYSPAGRLSQTWFRSSADLPDINDYDIIRAKRTYRYFDKPVLYPFGHGLSYGCFEYSGLSLSQESLTSGVDSALTVAFTVKNTGTAASDEVPQMYVAMPGIAAQRPLKTLTGFRRIHLEPGCSERIELTLPSGELMYYDIHSDRPEIEPGTYKLMIGASSEDIRLTGIFNVVADTVAGRDMTMVRAENFDDAENAVLCEDSGGDACVGIDGEGSLVYRRCLLTGEERSLTMRFGRGCRGSVTAVLDGRALASFSVKGKTAVRTAIEPHSGGELIFSFSGRFFFRDFYFEG